MSLMKVILLLILMCNVIQYNKYNINNSNII